MFYEKDFEIHNGPPMTFAGWVHTNGNLYLSSDNTFFQSLSAARRVLAAAAAAPGRSITAAGVPVKLQFDSRSVTPPPLWLAATPISTDDS